MILGDICSYMPDLLEQTAGVLRTGPLKVYTIPGNKNNDYGKAPEWYRAALGESCYAFDHKGWRFLMHDSFNPPPADWLKAQLTTPEPGMPIIFCAHAPPEAKDYIRFDLSTSSIPTGAKIKRVSLTLHSPWQHSIDLADRLCGYFVGLLEEDFKANMTFASRPARPGWPGEPQPESVLKGTWPLLEIEIEQSQETK